MQLKNLFRIIAFLEGTSFVLLLFIAVPIKYWGNNEIWVKILGMPHGLLFVSYIVLALLIRIKMNWNRKTLFIILSCSIIPFGTYYVERKILKNN